MPIRLHQIDIPSPWQPVLDRLCAHPATVIILGAPDTGKSTLTRLLIHRLQQAGEVIGWIDCDVGQSDLGPPTTIASAVVTPWTQLEPQIDPQAMRFIGSVSPSGHLLPTIVGAHRMVHLARQRGAEAIVLNTSGMVQGGPARMLKQHLIDLLQPDTILALQRKAEIEHLLRPIEQRGRCHIDRLPVSAKARSRSRESRRQIRQHHFRMYFEKAELRSLIFSQLSLGNSFLGSGARLSDQQLADAASILAATVVYGEKCGDGLYLVGQGQVRDHSFYLLKDLFEVEHCSLIPLIDFRNRLVGLCDAASDLLALALLRQVDWTTESIQVLTPLAESTLPQVKVVQFGSMRVDPTGQASPLQWRL